MSTKTITVVKKSTILTVISFVAVISFRFFLGRPMNGKTTDNSTFLKGATKGRPGRVLTRWQKKPHLHRSLIRQSVFWPTCTLSALFIVDRTAALFVVAFISFPIGWLLFRKGRLIFFDPFTMTDATTGTRTQLWSLKNRYKTLLHRQPIPGLVKRGERFDPRLSAEAQEVIAADINEGNLKGIVHPLFPEKITRYRRASKRTDR